MPSSSSSSSCHGPDTTTNPIMSISSLLEPSSDTHQHAPSLLPPMISPSSSSSQEDDEMLLLPPLDKSLFMQHSSSSTSRSPSPDPRDSMPSSLEQRRRRNKIASAKYRAKRSQENKNMRQALEHLRRQNAVLLQALNDAYRDKSNMGDAAEQLWSLSSSSAASNRHQADDDGNIHCATYPTTCTIHQRTYPMSF